MSVVARLGRRLPLGGATFQGVAVAGGTGAEAGSRLLRTLGKELVYPELEAGVRRGGGLHTFREGKAGGRRRQRQTPAGAGASR